MNNFLILGAGCYGKTIRETVKTIGYWDSIKFLDDHDKGSDILGACKEYCEFIGQFQYAYPAFGNNNGLRIEWMEKLSNAGFKIPTLIHPNAYISPSVNLETGVVVLPGAVVQRDTTLGKGCLINIGAIIDHDNIISEGCHIAPGVIIKAYNVIPQRMKIESGRCILTNVYKRGEEYAQ